MLPPPPVSLRGSPPPAATRYTSLTGSMSQSGSRPETKASVAPSGDHAGAESSKSPSVSWTGAPLPSAVTVNRCWRRSPVQPTVSSLYCRRVKRRGARRLSSSSS